MIFWNLCYYTTAATKPKDNHPASMGRGGQWKTAIKKTTIWGKVLKQPHWNRKLTVRTRKLQLQDHHEKQTKVEKQSPAILPASEASRISWLWQSVDISQCVKAFFSAFVSRYITDSSGNSCWTIVSALNEAHQLTGPQRVINIDKTLTTDGGISCDHVTTGMCGRLSWHLSAFERTLK